MGRGVIDDVEVAVGKRRYLVDFLNAERSTVRCLAEWLYLPAFVAASSSAEWPFKYEGVSIAFIFDLIVKKEKLLFEILL